MTPIPWTDEQNRLLRQLCDQKLTADAIAARINGRTGSRFTRNAVIGRAGRAKIHLPIAAGSHGPRAKVYLPIAAGSHEPRAKLYDAAPLMPLPPRWKPGRILLRAGWLDGGFR